MPVPLLSRPHQQGATHPSAKPPSCELLSMANYHHNNSAHYRLASLDDPRTRHTTIQYRMTNSNWLAPCIATQDMHTILESAWAHCCSGQPYKEYIRRPLSRSLLSNTTTTINPEISTEPGCSHQQPCGAARNTFMHSTDCECCCATTCCLG